MKYGQFLKFQGGVKEFPGSRGDEDLWGVGKFSRSRVGWPMSDNEIFPGFRPQRTLCHEFMVLGDAFFKTQAISAFSKSFLWEFVYAVSSNNKFTSRKNINQEKT